MDVLILDDQIAMRQLLAKTLERSGWTVCEAATVAGARECLALHEPRIIVADRYLGDREDGHEFASEVFQGARPVAVVYISASVDALAGIALRPGEWALAKPFMPAALVDAVLQAVRQLGHTVPSACTAAVLPLVAPRQFPSGQPGAR